MASPSVRIRTARNDDLPALHELMYESYMALVVSGVEWSEAVSQSWVWSVEHMNLRLERCLFKSRTLMAGFFRICGALISVSNKPHLRYSFNRRSTTPAARTRPSTISFTTWLWLAGE